MDLKSKLLDPRETVLLYGSTPPRLGTAGEQVEAAATKLAERVAPLPVDALVVYDIQDETGRTQLARPPSQGGWRFALTSSPSGCPPPPPPSPPSPTPCAPAGAPASSRAAWCSPSRPAAARRPWLSPAGSACTCPPRPSRRSSAPR